MKRKKIPMVINISLYEEDKKTLEALAEKEERSMARQISFIIKKYLEDNNHLERDDSKDYN